MVNRAFFYRCIAPNVRLFFSQLLLLLKKTMKIFQIALLLALVFPALSDVSAQQSKSGFNKSSNSRSSSFKGGFSSQRPASTSGKRNPSPEGPGFGSFGSAKAATQQESASALSRRLTKSAAEANALRTLDARRAAQQAAVPVPALPPYGNHGTASAHNDYVARHGQLNLPPPAPVILHQPSDGVGNVITGILLGRATAGANARPHAYPGNVDQRSVRRADDSGAFIGAMLRAFAWLLVLATLAWVAYFTWKFLRRGKAPSSANYSFER